MPGLINIHSHPEHEPLYRGIREEHGVRNMHMTGLYERSQAFSAPDDEARAASAEFAYCELLLSGVTSLVDISPRLGRLGRAVRQKRHARLSRAGLRLGALVPRKRSRAEIRLGRGARPGGLRDRARGDRRAPLEHPSGRLSGVVSPMQIDNCTADLLRDSRDAARERGLPFTVHVAQSVIEVQRDDPPARQDAGRNGRMSSASSGPARSSATRSFSTRIPGSAGGPGPICG